MLLCVSQTDCIHKGKVPSWSGCPCKNSLADRKGRIDASSRCRSYDYSLQTCRQRLCILDIWQLHCLSSISQNLHLLSIGHTHGQYVRLHRNRNKPRYRRIYTEFPLFRSPFLHNYHRKAQGTIWDLDRGRPLHYLKIACTYWIKSRWRRLAHPIPRTLCHNHFACMKCASLFLVRWDFGGNLRDSTCKSDGHIAMKRNLLAPLHCSTSHMFLTHRSWHLLQRFNFWIQKAFAVHLAI